MKTVSYLDAQGQERYYLACVESELYEYHRMMFDAGMGRCLFPMESGRTAYAFLPIKRLIQIGVRHYKWVDENRKSRHEVLPVYRDALE